MAHGKSLGGSGSITPQDYYGLPANALANNPPACGMPYNQLNLALITAVEKMDTSSTCNQCLKVVNTRKPSIFIYVLAVDLGGSGLDLSIPAFNYLFNQSYDASPASWSTVDDSFCTGIYTPGKINNNQGIAGPALGDQSPKTTSTTSANTSTSTSTRSRRTTTTTTTKRKTKTIKTSTKKRTSLRKKLPKTNYGSKMPKRPFYRGRHNSLNNAYS